MEIIRGIDSICKIFKSSKGRKYYYTVTYFDLENSIKVKRKFPNVVSEYFKTKKSLISDNLYLQYENKLR